MSKGKTFYYSAPSSRPVDEHRANVAIIEHLLDARCVLSWWKPETRSMMVASYVEIEAVKRADILVCFPRSPMAGSMITPGMMVEIGAAIGCGKKVVVCGPHADEVVSRRGKDNDLFFLNHPLVFTLDEYMISEWRKGCSEYLADKVEKRDDDDDEETTDQYIRDDDWLEWVPAPGSGNDKAN